MIEQICSTCLSYMITVKLDGWLKCPNCGFMKKQSISMITMQEILMGRVNFLDLPEELQKNGEALLEAVNKFRKEYGKPMYVSSGYRSPEINKATAGSAKNSAHMSLQACDFKDDGSIFEFIKKDPTILERCNLYMEDPRWTPTWIHLQVRKPASGNRIFLPYSDGRPETAPERKI